MVNNIYEMKKWEKNNFNNMISFVQFNPIFGAKSPIFENHKERDKMLKNGSFLIL